MTLIECSTSPQEFRNHLQLRNYQAVWLQALLDEIIIELDSFTTVINIAKKRDIANPSLDDDILRFLDCISYEAIEVRKVRLTPQEQQKRYEKLNDYKAWIEYLLKQINLDIQFISIILALPNLSGKKSLKPLL